MKKELSEAGKKVAAFFMAAAEAKRNRAEEKFLATHEHLGAIQAPHINEEKRIKRGQPIPLMEPHTRQLYGKDGKPLLNEAGVPRQELVEVNVWRYTGWDHGKKYTGSKLRELRAERNAA